MMYKTIRTSFMSFMVIALTVSSVFSAESATLDQSEQSVFDKQVLVKDQQKEIDQMTDSVYQDSKELLSKISSLIAKKSNHLIKNMNIKIQDFYTSAYNLVTDIGSKDEQDYKELSSCMYPKWKAFKKSMIEAIQELDIEEQLRDENTALKKQLADIEKNKITNEYQIAVVEEKDADIKKLGKKLADNQSTLTKYQAALVGTIIAFVGYELFKYCKSSEVQEE